MNVHQVNIQTDSFERCVNVAARKKLPHPEVLARYINDHYLQPMKTNVKFIKLKEQRVALIVTLRDLIPGEEIFASYGQG